MIASKRCEGSGGRIIPPEPETFARCGFSSSPPTLKRMLAMKSMRVSREDLSIAKTLAKEARRRYFENHPSIQRVAETMGEAFSKPCESLRKGSLRAAVRLMCVQCSGHSEAEARQCTAIGCPLHAFRPGQKRRIKAKTS